VCLFSGCPGPDYVDQAEPRGPELRPLYYAIPLVFWVPIGTSLDLHNKVKLALCTGIEP